MVKKKIVVITGASSGIGYVFTKELASGPFILNVCSRNIAKIKKKFKKKRNIFVYKVDVSNEKEIKNFVSNIKKKYGKIDILINNAGVVLKSKFEKIDSKKLEKLFKTNVYAPFYFIRECLPTMKKKNFGRIVNISSGGSVNCAEEFSTYSSSKAALNTIAKSLKNEIKKYNIKINTLSPGPCKTKMFPKNPLSPKLCLPTLKYLININQNGPSGEFFWFMKKINIIPKLKIDWSKPKNK